MDTGQSDDLNSHDLLQAPFSSQTKGRGDLRIAVVGTADRCKFLFNRMIESWRTSRKTPRHHWRGKIPGSCFMPSRAPPTRRQICSLRLHRSNQEELLSPVRLVVIFKRAWTFASNQCTHAVQSTFHDLSRSYPWVGTTMLPTSCSICPHGAYHVSIFIG